MQVENLFDAYRRWWLQTTHIQRMKESHPVNLPKLTDERRILFEDLIQWCKTQSIDPRLWLYCLFRRRRWQYAPKMSRGHLLSDKMVPHYREMMDKQTLDGYRKFVQLEKAESPLDPNRDIIPMAEAMKSRFKKYGQVDRCFLESPSITFGYHPKSDHCVNCSMSEECKVQLKSLVNFDILALRRGDISAKEARVQAGAYK